jgi:CO/xanthine dehydrogenase FAD-binding subunit
MLPEFDLLTPFDLNEALAIMATDENIVPIAGGTNLVVDLRSNKRTPARLVNIGPLDELRHLYSKNGVIVIGGGCTLSQVLRSPEIQESALVLCEAARHFANPLIRNRATLGGNLVDASPAADTAPPLLVLDAEVLLTSSIGCRVIPINKFFTGVRKTCLGPGELLTEVRWHRPDSQAKFAFYKLGLRQADAISVVSVAVNITISEKGDCHFARIALGSVAPIPKRAYRAEEYLVGRVLDLSTAEEAGRIAADEVSPISDLRASAEYRKKIVKVLVHRLLLKVAGKGSESERQSL